MVCDSMGLEWTQCSAHAVAYTATTSLGQYHWYLEDIHLVYCTLMHKCKADERLSAVRSCFLKEMLSPSLHRLAHEKDGHSQINEFNFLSIERLSLLPSRLNTSVCHDCLHVTRVFLCYVLLVAATCITTMLFV